MKRRFLFFLLALLCAGSAATRAFAEAQWNTNLLQNTIPSNESQFTGWEVSNGGDGWSIENGWFNSSYAICVMRQTVSLADKGFSGIDYTQVRLYVSVQYEIPWPGNSKDGKCMAAVVCLNNNDQCIDTLYLLNKNSYRKLEVKPTLKDSLYTLPAGTQKLCYFIEGKDQLNWVGQYGPRFSAMDMRLFQSSDIPTNFTATVDPAIGDSITLSKTSNIAFGEAITVSATYPDFPIRRIITTPVQFVEDATIICRNDIVVSAQFRYMHNVLTDNTYATITATPSRALEGDTITLSHTMNGDAVFSNYTTDVEVKWLDEYRFIMPDADITIGVQSVGTRNVPFFDGFEGGHKNNSTITTWHQQSESGENTWVYNSDDDDNRTPKNGSWNATLRYSNTCWLYQSVHLEAGKGYRISMYARQDGDDKNNANLTVSLGKGMDKDSMKTVLIPRTGLLDGDYQHLYRTFTVETTDNYVLGIRGEINDVPWYISIDDISLAEHKAHSIGITSVEHCTIVPAKATAFPGDTVALTITVDESYLLDTINSNVALYWIDKTHFIMPGEDVVLTPQLHLMSSAILDIVETAAVHIKVTRNGEELANHTKVYEGETLDVAFIAAAGCKITNDPDGQFKIEPSHFVNDTLRLSAEVADVVFVGTTPYVTCPDSTTAVVGWENLHCEYDIVISEQEITNFGYIKGIHHTTDTTYTKRNLIPGQTYYVYLCAYMNGTEKVWNQTRFAMFPTSAGTGCQLTIRCIDDYGDGWDGGKLRIVENNMETFFDTKKSDDTFYYNTLGGKVDIYWQKGEYDDEISFSVRNEDGDILNISDANKLKDGECLFSGNPCIVCLAPEIKSVGNKGTDIIVSWTNIGAASYNVALVNKSSATNEELNTLKVSTTDTAYTFHNIDTCKYYMVYVQAQCDEQSTSMWVSDIYWGKAPATPQWQSVSPNYIHHGDILTDGRTLSSLIPGPCLLYKVSLTETQTLYVAGTTSSNPIGIAIVPMDENGNVDLENNSQKIQDTITLAAGDYGIIGVSMEASEYDMYICRVVPTYYTPVTLPYRDTLTNNEWYVRGGFYRGFEFTLTEPTLIEILMQAPWDGPCTFDLSLYRNGEDSIIKLYEDRYIDTLQAGTYHIIARSDTTSYVLSIGAPQTYFFEPISTDTILSGTIQTDTRYPLNGMMVPGKGYTFNAEEKQIYGMLLYTPDKDSTAVFVYSDSLLTNRVTVIESMGMDSTMYNGFEAKKSGPYYVVVYHISQTPNATSRFTYVQHLMIEEAPVDGKLTIGDVQPVVLNHKSTLMEGGATTAYTVHVEKDKTYRFYADIPEDAIYAVLGLRNPETNDIIQSARVHQESQTIILGYSHSADDMDLTVLLASVGPLKANNDADYRIAYEEIMPIDSLIENAPTVVLPLRQEAEFGSAKYKNMNGTYDWWYPIYDYLSGYAIYSAEAYTVKVNPNDTLFAMLSTDDEAVLHFYHIYSPIGVGNPVVIDDVQGYPYIAERGYYHNESDSVETIVVIASVDNYRPGKHQYNIVLSKSEQDISLQTATAKASANAIYLEKIDMGTVRDALSHLTLTAEDAQGKTIATIDNIPFYWDIDLTDNTATYEVNQTDLPIGYAFANEVEYIRVEIHTAEVVYPMINQSDLKLTDYTEQAARKALSALIISAIDHNGKTVHTFTNVAENWSIDLSTGMATYTLHTFDLPDGYIFETAEVSVSVQLQNGTGLENTKGNNTLRIYPNPAHDYTFVEGTTEEIHIYDLTGRPVMRVPAENGTTMLDITALPAGMYTVRSAGETAPLLVK